MRLRKMLVTVRQRLVPMQMTMRLAASTGGFVGMLMVFIVNMLVAMFNHLMGMQMLVLLGQVQPDANAHHQSRKDQCRRQRLAQ